MSAMKYSLRLLSCSLAMLKIIETSLTSMTYPPRSMPRRTPERVEAAVVLARQELRAGPGFIAEATGVPERTVTRILRRAGLPRLAECDPLTGQVIRASRHSFQRYERDRPGALIHVDVKKLGRIVGGAGHRVTGTHGRLNSGRRPKRVGWDFVHVAIDDATRLAYAEVLSDEKGTTAVAFLRRALAFYRRHGIQVERVMTDNGSPYVSTVHAVACRALGVRHLRTRPRRPQTNGKAERFIRTLQGGWAYGAIYRSSHERTRALDGWLHHYNHHRRHAALGHHPPIHRLNNLLGTYI